ncbi:MAG: hypothetical protein AAGA60_18880 [Cyanobacteria bacterium P01_E01_bin.42]
MFGLLVLVVYLIIVARVFYQMWLDLDEFISVDLDSASLNEQLQLQQLQDAIAIGFKFKKYYKPHELKTLVVEISNKTNVHTIYVDWERCSLADFEDGSQRIVRIVPGLSSLSQGQTFSLLPPTQKLEAELTVESVLQSNEQGELVVTSPLFKSKDLFEAVKDKKRFTLLLVIEVSSLTVGERRGSVHPLFCHFTLRKTPKQTTMYWVKEKKKKKK